MTRTYQERGFGLLSFCQVSWSAHRPWIPFLDFRTGHDISLIWSIMSILNMALLSRILKVAHSPTRRARKCFDLPTRTRLLGMHLAMQGISWCSSDTHPTEDTCFITPSCAQERRQSMQVLLYMAVVPKGPTCLAGPTKSACIMIMTPTSEPLPYELLSTFLVSQK